MADEVFRPGKRKPERPDNSIGDPFQRLKEVNQAAAVESGAATVTPPTNMSPPPAMDSPFMGNMSDSPIHMSGKVPEEFQRILQAQRSGQAPVQERQEIVRPQRSEPNYTSGSLSPAFENLVSRLNNVVAWEKIDLPSQGKFYSDIPGSLHVRPMTGYEEQILTQQRFVKRGQAIDMIFQQCVKEKIQPEKLLAVDRTYLLIYLRGISYTTEYDVEIKCPECAFKFNKVINLDLLEVQPCEEDFGPDNLFGILPTSGFKFSYRLPTGQDDLEVARHREKRLKGFNEQQDDDTVMHRLSLLLNDIEGVSDKQELMHLLKKLPVNDVVHIRNVINVPPFGVDTSVPMGCPSCFADFDVDLPFEVGFFFPKKKKA